MVENGFKNDQKLKRLPCKVVNWLQASFALFASPIHTQLHIHINKPHQVFIVSNCLYPEMKFPSWNFSFGGYHSSVSSSLILYANNWPTAQPSLRLLFHRSRTRRSLNKNRPMRRACLAAVVSPTDGWDYFPSFCQPQPWFTALAYSTSKLTVNVFAGAFSCPG